MAPRNRKIRSFSPYQYNIQYAKPGRGPAQTAKPYVKTASITENEYVVTKLDPKYFTFLENSFYYTIGDECDVQFNKLVSTFRVRNDKHLLEYESSEILENKIYSKTFEVTKKNGIQYYWKSGNILNITHNLNSIVDCIVLLNDYEYLKFRKRDIGENVIDLEFINEISNIDKLTITIFQLSNNFNISDNIISLKTYNNSEIIDDTLKNVIALDNKFGNSNLFPIVYDTTNTSYILRNYDLSPSYIAFNKDIFTSIDDLNNTLEYCSSKIKEIEMNNPSTPSDVLYKEDEKYKNYVDSFNDGTKKIENLKQLNYKYDISKIILYYFNKKYSKFEIIRNINSSLINWIDEKTVQLIHNLKGNVLLILDSITFYDYTIYKVDENQILIKFLNDVPLTFTTRLYEVN